MQRQLVALPPLGGAAAAAQPAGLDSFDQRSAIGPSALLRGGSPAEEPAANSRSPVTRRSISRSKASSAADDP
jgi:hypothetical protein